MKQIVQSFSEGRVELIDVPQPEVRSGHLLIRTCRSLVSIGTERMLVQFGRSSYLEKARQQPERVKMVLDKVKTDGLLTTWDTVKTKLEHPIPLGYANAGIVLAVGKGVTGFRVGDRVVSNGPHAQVVSVPATLCARIPENVSFDEACFTVVASVGLQGIRLAQPTLGETFLVIGLGLIGLMTAQMLRAQGVKVLGLDIDERRCAQARSLGLEALNPTTVADPVTHLLSLTDQRGVDGVLVTASTQSSEPLTLAAKVCRQRGRIVLVGVADIALNRTDFYNKELSFQVSCSYGPGRYDPQYEQQGKDYPYGFVRWTAQRNFEAVLGLLATQQLQVLPLLEKKVPFENAPQAYEGEVLKSALGVVLTYEEEPDRSSRVTLLPSPSPAPKVQEVVVGLVGAGNYTAQVLVKNLARSGVRLKTIASPGGLNATLVGRKYGFETATSRVEHVFQDPEINVVVISVRHDLHVPLALEALKNGKHVFVEKPLAVDEEQLQTLQAYYESLPRESRPHLMTGFNRRFAPLVKDMKKLMATRREPAHIVMTVNAGHIPADHWAQDPVSGGGRLVGEGCHFVDLARDLLGSPLVAFSAEALPSTLPVPDSVSARLRFADGSLATLLYLSNGAKSFPKERVEVFCEGAVLQLDNFRKLRAFGWRGYRGRSLWRQDKGHFQAWEAFVESLRDGQELIPWGEMVEVTRATFALQAQLKSEVSVSQRSRADDSTGRAIGDDMIRNGAGHDSSRPDDRLGSHMDTV